MTMTLRRPARLSKTPRPPLFLTPREVARELGVTSAELKAMNANGTGPAFATIDGTTIRYWRVLVVEWKQKHRA